MREHNLRLAGQRIPWMSRGTASSADFSSICWHAFSLRSHRTRWHGALARHLLTNPGAPSIIVCRHAALLLRNSSARAARLWHPCAGLLSGALRAMLGPFALALALAHPDLDGIRYDCRRDVEPVRGHVPTMLTRRTLGLLAILLFGTVSLLESNTDSWQFRISSPPPAAIPWLAVWRSALPMALSGARCRVERIVVR